MEFKNVERKNKEDVSLLVATNHRYFVRFVITMVVINMLLAFGLTVLNLIFGAVAAAEAADAKSKSDGSWILGFVAVSCIIYLIVFVVQMSHILMLNQRISATEEHFVPDADVVR